MYIYFVSNTSTLVFQLLIYSWYYTAPFTLCCHTVALFSYCFCYYTTYLCARITNFVATLGARHTLTHIGQGKPYHMLCDPGQGKVTSSHMSPRGWDFWDVSCWGERSSAIETNQDGAAKKLFTLPLRKDDNCNICAVQCAEWYIIYF